MTRPRPRITYPRPAGDVFALLIGRPAPPRYWVITCPAECGIGDGGWTAHADTLPAAYHRAIAHLEADHPEEDQ